MNTKSDAICFKTWPIPTFVWQCITLYSCDFGIVFKESLFISSNVTSGAKTRTENSILLRISGNGTP